MTKIPGFTCYALKGTEVIEFCDIEEYARYREANPDCRIVKQEYVAGAFLSTVLLPFPVYSFGGGGPRQFETMVFYGPDERHAHVMSRYETYEAAYAAHVAIAGCMRVLEKDDFEVNDAALTAIEYGVFGGE